MGAEQRKRDEAERQRVGEKRAMQRDHRVRRKQDPGQRRDQARAPAEKLSSKNVSAELRDDQDEKGPDLQRSKRINSERFHRCYAQPTAERRVESETRAAAPTLHQP